MTRALWHDAQQGGYVVDLPIWRALALIAKPDRAPVLELGAGTGRVATVMQQHAEVWALDSDPELIDELTRRSVGAVHCVTGDACNFALDQTFRLIYAPAAFIQVIGGADRRAAMLECCRAHLTPGGLAAFAVMDLTATIEPSDAFCVVQDDVSYEAAITDVERLDGGRLRLAWSRMLRPTWKRRGWRSLEPWTMEYETVDAATVDREARHAGLEVVEVMNAEPSEWVAQAVYVLRRL